MYKTKEFEQKLRSLIVGLNPGEWKQVYRNTLGMSMYVTTCTTCKCEPVTNWSKNSKNTYKCKKCREKEKEDAGQLVKQIYELTMLRRLDKAKQIIRKRYYDCSEYEESIVKIQKHFNKPGWFQSANEILAALEFLRSKIKVRHQVKMGKWSIDFILPDMKVALEIDGGFHDNTERRQKDKLKDAAIIANLGPEWEVVRIKDTLIKEDLKKLLPAIRTVIDSRDKVRKSHNGLLPKNYSNTAI